VNRSLDRRTLLKRSGAVAAATLLPGAGFGQEQRRFSPQPGAARSFDLTLTVDVADAQGGGTRVWLPLPDIDTEWQRTEDVLRKVTRCNELLDNVPWLQRSIAVRNGYVDPLNLIQAELQDRSRQPDAGKHTEELTQLKQLVVKGLAAGMRTTG